MKISEIKYRIVVHNSNPTMPYRKKSTTYRRRKTYRNAVLPSMGATAISMIKGYALKALKNKLGLNTESKYWDKTSSTTGAATLTLITQPQDLIAQGNTTTTRNGDSIRLTHMNIRGHIVHNAVDTAAGQTRIIITNQPVCPGTSQLAAASILQDVTNINSPYAQNLSGLQILFDKTLSQVQLRTLHRGSSSSTLQLTITFDGQRAIPLVPLITLKRELLIYLLSHKRLQLTTALC